MRHILALALGGAGVLGFAMSAAAQAPVAVVEDVKGAVAGVEFMDYVTPGTRIELGSSGSIVLSYMKSCRREAIRGGTITVGAEQSTVDGGKVARTTVACDATHIELGGRETSQSAATVFRNLAPATEPASPPQITLHGRSPVVETNGPGTLLVERIDRRGERYELMLDSKSLARGRFYDFAKFHRALTPGATYSATLGESRIVFRIAPEAKPGSTPIIGRLLRLAQGR